jgi:outer membrane biosynthesis protein TonB
MFAGMRGNGAAIRMVRRAAPFPRMPANINRQSASFSVPIRFSR